MDTAQVSAYFAGVLGGTHWNAATPAQQSAAVASAVEEIETHFQLAAGYESDPRFLRAVSRLANFLLKPAAATTYSRIKVGPIEIDPVTPDNAVKKPDLRLLLGDLVVPAVNPYRWDFR